jgi:hypothetical protein
MTVVEAVIAIAKADHSRWVEFRREQSVVTKHETDYAAEQFLKAWFDLSLRFSVRGRRLDGWVQQFILDFFSEALAGRLSVKGFVSGLREMTIPTIVFRSMGLISDVFIDGKGFWENELRLPMEPWFML